jgi:hypothetical protein
MPDAMDLAKTWEEDAHLIWAEVSVLPTSEVVFAFDSASEPKHGALVYVEQPLGDPHWRLEDVAAAGRMEALPPIEPSAWGVLDSPSAYLTALGEGGEDFLEKTANIDRVVVRLQFADTPRGGGVVWRVTFGSPLETTYDVLIDPRTGESIQAVERP